MENKNIIEAIIFASEEPLTFKMIKQVLPELDKKAVLELIEELNNDYAKSNRAFNIQQLGGGFLITTLPEYAECLKKIFNLRKKGKLSKPALETLSIIAYKQPVTKPEIEGIRGVNSDGVVSMLLEKDFVKILGRKDVPGRPIIFGTTEKFLTYFGLATIKDLPDIEEFSKKGEEIGQEREIEQTQE